jgi:PqqD family protein of HPr-rel-A system
MNQRADATTHWASAGCQRLLTKCWENDVFVFNPASGHTHTLNIEAWRLVIELDARSMTEAQVVDYFSASSPEAIDTVRASLAQLEMFGLIDRR